MISPSDNSKPCGVTLPLYMYYHETRCGIVSESSIYFFHLAPTKERTVQRDKGCHCQWEREKLTIKPNHTFSCRVGEANDFDIYLFRYSRNH